MSLIGPIVVLLLFCVFALGARSITPWILRSQTRTWGFRYDDESLGIAVWIVRLVGIVGIAGGVAFFLQAWGHG
jgi:hypothetical protein